MNTKVEFHCHSNASDGVLSPTEVVKRAKNNCVSILALTDHDTTQGLDEAILAGKHYGVKIIPGIELSTIHNNENIHILGYFKDHSYKNKYFQQFLKEIEDSRVLRGKKMVENLKTFFNIDIDYNKVLEKGNGVIARPHIASTIIDAGYNYSWEHIFNKFISNDSPAYVHNKKVSIEDGINLIKKNNGIVILAHPKLIRNTPVEKMVQYDFDGIESIYFQNFKKDTSHLISIARNNNLLITCGSDFHGIEKGDTKHGDIGDMSSQLDEDDLYKLLNALNIYI